MPAASHVAASQIRNVRIGQPVRAVSDLYGPDVIFHGRIVGLSPGTGSAFSMLPPQNAAGNWVKVVQRVPVMVSLEPADMAARPLPVGVSMTVSIDTHQRGGPLLGASAPRSPAPSPAVASHAAHEADALVHGLLGNAGQPSTRHPGSTTSAISRQTH